ncbi:MAG: FAD-binding protein [Acidobacteria bacterium]|nr:FAD-binding protein [Acidobacteriota bacterium]MSO82222.1 FAD-binding protein [Acidobacteriota bacterium]
MSVRDVLIIGAGPSGLATAIAAKHFGLDYLVLEKGSLVDGIARFPTNMVFFTTPELLEIGGLPLTTPYDKPTRAEALQYYRKVVDTFQLHISLFEEATEVESPTTPGEPFAVHTKTVRGVTRVREAHNVVLAMGYYGAPVMLNIPGEDLPYVSHFYQEAHPYLSPARGDCWRQELRGRGGSGDSPHRRTRHDRASRRGVRRLHQVLGQARHREPGEGRIDRGTLQRERRRHSPNRGPRRRRWWRQPFRVA